jgi:DNA processing protein
VLVVEAGRTSGALITADFALEQGRDVFAVPGSIFSPGCEGTHQLLRDGARLVSDARDILEELNLAAEALDGASAVRPTDPTEALILSFLGAEPQHIDTIGRAAGIPIGELAGTLTLMELRGLVRQVGGMQYVRHGRYVESGRERGTSAG